MSIPRNLSKLAEGTDSSGVLGIAYGGTGGGTTATAKAALGLHAVATSGSYADLLNKPTTANIVENTNLYFTDARSRASVSASGSLSYNSATGVFSYTTPSTSGISEGTNLYYTDARARGALSASTGISYNSTTGAISTTITQYTDTLARGAVSASGDLSYNSTTGVFSYTTPSTSGIVEGTNLYFTDARARASISVTGAGSYNSTTGVINIVGGVTSFNTRTGAIALSSADVTGALGFTPYNATNPSGYLTGITSSQVTTALGFTPYNSTNPNGYITGITSGMVTTALGYTPYNSSNPSGYITSSALSGYLTSASAASTYAPLTGTGASGTWAISVSGNSATTSQRAFSGDISTTGQGRFTGWYAGGAATGFAVEVGISGGEGYILSYNRDTSSYGTLNLSATNIRLAPQGGTLTGPGGSVILHAGNYSSYALPLTGGVVAGPVTITGNDNQLVIDATSGATAGIFLRHSGVNKWEIFNSSNVFGLYNYSSGQTEFTITAATNTANFRNTPTAGGNAILHASNYSSYALPLSGGTLSGDVTFGGNNTYFGGMVYLRANSDFNFLTNSGNAQSGKFRGIQVSDSYSGSVPTNGILFSTDTTLVRNTSGQLDISGNRILHAGNYTSYAATAGHNHTYDVNNAWLRDANDDANVKLYGNTRQMVFRTDGTTEFASGVGGYAFAWMYGGDSANERRMLLASDGRLWTNYHGWLDTMSVSYASTAGSADAIDGVGFRNTGSNSGTNADTIESNGITYYTAGVPNFTGNAADGALYSQAYSSSWQHQIAGDYRSGQIALRGKNSGTWQSWRTVLDSSNYSSYALPLSGGTLSGDLRVNTVRDTSGIWVLGKYGSEVSLGSAGAVNEIRFNSSSAAAFEYRGSAILHAGNYSSYALPLSGGTVSGQTYISTSGYPLQLISTQRYMLQLRNPNNTTNAGYGWWLGHDTNFDFFMHADGLGDVLKLGRNGSFTVNGNTVLNAGNYNSYSPTLTGGNASGTWGISITGNAGSASSTTYLANLGTYVWSASTLPQGYPLGIQCSFVYAGWPSYGSVMNMNTYSGGGGALQMFVPYSPTYGGTSLLVRFGNYDVSSGNSWTSWKALLSSDNYTSYAPSLTGSGASGTWGINVTGSANSVSSSGGYTLTGNGSEGSSSSWIQFPNGQGIWSPTHGAHLLPNNTGSYGSWYMYGTKNGWYGLHFGSGSTLMMNSNEVGFHREGYGWQMRWMAGNGYVHKGNPGGGTEAVILDSSNYSSYALPLSGGTISGDITVSNGRKGLVGVYDPTQTQAVFAMGPSYKLTDGGGSSNYGNFYGLGWSYDPNYGGSGNNPQSKSGLGHQLLLMMAGTTRTALGTGIWTDGNITATANITAYSDERLKTNWQSMPENYVTRLAQVKVGIYDRIDGDKITQVGVSAQSFQKLLPEAILTAKDEMQTLSVSYGNAALASSVELAKEVVDLKTRVAQLEALIEKLIKE